MAKGKIEKSEPQFNSRFDSIDFRPFLGHEVVLLFISGSTIKGYLDRISDNGKMITIRREKPARFSRKSVWESVEGQDNNIGEVHLLASAIAGYYLFNDIPEDVISPNQAAQM